MRPDFSNIKYQPNIKIKKTRISDKVVGINAEQISVKSNYFKKDIKEAKHLQFASYAGTAPFSYSSGTSLKGRSRVSNLANKKIKSMLNMCARSAIVYNPELKLYYQAKKESGKNGMSSLNIIRNKLLARIFAVVDRGTPYVDVMKYAA